MKVIRRVRVYIVRPSIMARMGKKTFMFAPSRLPIFTFIERNEDAGIRAELEHGI